MPSVVVALGGNQGDVEKTFHHALRLLSEQGFCLQAVSALYTTRAWPDPRMPTYTNAAVRMRVPFGPWACLRRLRRVEQQLGRRRVKQRYASRTLDLDLIVFSNRKLITQRLIIPHPHAHLRDFVLVPICDFWPGLSLGPTKRSARSWLDCIKSGDRSIVERKYEASCNLASLRNFFWGMSVASTQARR